MFLVIPDCPSSDIRENACIGLWCLFSAISYRVHERCGSAELEGDGSKWAVCLFVLTEAVNTELGVKKERAQWCAEEERGALRRTVQEGMRWLMWRRVHNLSLVPWS